MSGVGGGDDVGARLSNLNYMRMLSAGNSLDAEKDGPREKRLSLCRRLAFSRTYRRSGRLWVVVVLGPDKRPIALLMKQVRECRKKRSGSLNASLGPKLVATPTITFVAHTPSLTTTTTP